MSIADYFRSVGSALYEQLAGAEQEHLAAMARLLRLVLVTRVGFGRLLVLPFLKRAG